MQNNLDIKIPNKYSPFIKDDFYSSLFKKTYRLTIAVSAISRDLELDPQLQEKLRNSIYETFDFVSLSLDNSGQMYDIKKLNHLVFLLNRNQSYLNCATQIGLFSSEINEIFNTVIGQIINEIEDYVSSQNKNVENFSFDLSDKKYSSANPNTQDPYKGHIKDIYRTTSNLSPKNINQTVVFKKDNDDRKAQILKIVSKKGNVSIKDISAEIKDCSEKTIQRELTKLVHDGDLNKTGERRWSTYSISKP